MSGDHIMLFADDGNEDEESRHFPSPHKQISVLSPTNDFGIYMNAMFFKE